MSGAAGKWIDHTYSNKYACPDHPESSLEELSPRLFSFNSPWGACSACHPNGLTDGVVWIFATGPRRTLPLNGSFNPRDPRDAKILNHSAIFDELQDFELNIRNVSGGLGLITLADGTTPDPNVKPFVPLANAGRSPALDAMTMFVAHGVRTPISPLSSRHHQGRKGHEVREGVLGQ